MCPWFFFSNLQCNGCGVRAFDWTLFDSVPSLLVPFSVNLTVTSKKWEVSRGFTFFFSTADFSKEPPLLAADWPRVLVSTTEPIPDPERDCRTQPEANRGGSRLISVAEKRRSGVQKFSPKVWIFVEAATFTGNCQLKSTYKDTFFYMKGISFNFGGCNIYNTVTYVLVQYCRQGVFQHDINLAFYHCSSSWPEVGVAARAVKPPGNLTLVQKFFSLPLSHWLPPSSHPSIHSLLLLQWWWGNPGAATGVAS